MVSRFENAGFTLYCNVRQNSSNVDEKLKVSQAEGDGHAPTDSNNTRYLGDFDFGTVDSAFVLEYAQQVDTSMMKVRNPYWSDFKYSVDFLV